MRTSEVDTVVACSVDGAVRKEHYHQQGDPWNKDIEVSVRRSLEVVEPQLHSSCNRCFLRTAMVLVEHCSIYWKAEEKIDGRLFSNTDLDRFSCRICAFLIGWNQLFGLWLICSKVQFSRKMIVFNSGGLTTFSRFCMAMVLNMYSINGKNRLCCA